MKTKSMHENKSRRIIILIVMGFCLVGAAAVCGQEPEQESSLTTQYVNAVGGLRMRSAPNLESERITTIPDGAEVLTQQTKGEIITIGGAAGRWTEVRYENSGSGEVFEGWVFGGFLSEVKDRKLSLKAALKSGKFDPASADDPDCRAITYDKDADQIGCYIGASEQCRIKKISDKGRYIAIAYKAEFASEVETWEDYTCKVDRNADFHEPTPERLSGVYYFVPQLSPESEAGEPFGGWIYQLDVDKQELIAFDCLAQRSFDVEIRTLTDGDYSIQISGNGNGMAEEMRLAKDLERLDDYLQISGRKIRSGLEEWADAGPSDCESFLHPEYFE